MKSNEPNKPQSTNEPQVKKIEGVPKDTIRMLEQKQQAAKCDAECRNKLAQRLYHQQENKASKQSAQSQKCTTQCKCGSLCTCKSQTQKSGKPCSCKDCAKQCVCAKQCPCRKCLAQCTCGASKNCQLCQYQCKCGIQCPCDFAAGKKEKKQEKQPESRGQKQTNQGTSKKGMKQPKDLIDLSIQPERIQPNLQQKEDEQQLRKQFYNQKNNNENGTGKKEKSIQRKDQLTPRAGQRILKQLNQHQINEQKQQMQLFKQSMKKKTTSQPSKGDQNTSSLRKQQKKKSAA